MAHGRPTAKWRREIPDQETHWESFRNAIKWKIIKSN
jgi:hypothetical protein